MHELLTNDQMSTADALTIERGTPGIVLMENAGRAIAQHILSHFSDATEFLILCGPGNNGGDGFVIARWLQRHDRKVSVGLLGDKNKIKGDALQMLAAWQGGIEPLSVALVSGFRGVIVDALFGAGLMRDISDEIGQIFQVVNAQQNPVVAVDIPSGVDGNSGAIRGHAIRAQHTVTFFRKKPGHLLLPGRAYCNEVYTADIGIDADVLATIDPKIFENGPGIFGSWLKEPKVDSHKYERGSTMVLSGDAASTGAARLGARAALRVGAGVVTVLCEPEAVAANAAHLTSIMIRVFTSLDELRAILADSRIRAILIGPAAGVNPATRDRVLEILKTEAAVVLDADALTVFTDNPEELFGAIQARAGVPVVMTPHLGEFGRLFSSLLSGDQPQQGSVRSKCEQACQASQASGAYVVFKGGDTVIASPDGQVAINANAPAWLATAGSGDVLAGTIAGLLAQGLPGFEAACAGVWLHGAMGTVAGPGLIAEDLADRLPEVLNRHFGEM